MWWGCDLVFAPLCSSGKAPRGSTPSGRRTECFDHLLQGPALSHAPPDLCSMSNCPHPRDSSELALRQAVPSASVHWFPALFSAWRHTGRCSRQRYGVLGYSNSPVSSSIISSTSPFADRPMAWWIEWTLNHGHPQSDLGSQRKYPLEHRATGYVSRWN